MAHLPGSARTTIVLSQSGICVLFTLACEHSVPICRRGFRQVSQPLPKAHAARRLARGPIPQLKRCGLIEAYVSIQVLCFSFTDSAAETLRPH